MSRRPRLRAAQTRLFRTRDQDADLGVFELDARIFERFEHRDAHIAAGQVVVRAVHDLPFVPHDVHEQPRGHEAEGAERELGDQDAFHKEGRDGHAEQIEHADDGEDDMSAEQHSAAEIIESPLAGGVGMSVEEHAAAHLAGRLFDGGNIVGHLLRVDLVHHLAVHDELADHDHHADDYEHHRNYPARKVRHEEQTERREDEGHGDVDPAHERRGVQLERLHLHIVAAEVSERVRHILARLLLALAAGTALAELLDDGSDLRLHELGGGGFVCFYAVKVHIALRSLNTHIVHYPANFFNTKMKLSARERDQAKNPLIVR